MTDKLKPVLSAEEWKRTGPNGRGHPLTPSLLSEMDYLDPDELRKAIAVANDLLPDSDDRKLTREKIALLRVIVSQWDGCGPDPLAQQAWLNDDTGTVPEPPHDHLGDRFDPSAFLDALETYLPQERR
jgi:hypothetical protein